MKTKTTLLTALVAFAGGASLMAQVYSVNMVGYVNLTIPNGFSMIANPLNATTNTIAQLLPAPPEGTIVYKFNGTSYAINSFNFGEWDVPNQTLNPGEGCFIKNTSGAPFTNTFVGEVMVGNLTNAIPSGFSIRASQVPQAGQLDTILGFPVAEGDVVYKFNPGTQNYSIHSYDFGEWSAVPTIAVGESFFVKKLAPANWTRTFTVN